ncbi:hypothetical protein [Acetivibrio clariflavus]|uniref:hypothetical protein n=1 Tax=Acetivibrio clariflavus TaxID=288965 RepID=UPI0002F10071|nr:hypothetical protein [Acetivibrio clariflavus]
MYQYGTLGYAAPECYSKATDNSKFPFTVSFEQGKMSIESDIFSFGATFWECLNIFEMVTKNKEFSDDIHEFYRNNFLNDNTYFNRDLSCTSSYYHKKLEAIIKKCTRKRTNSYCDLDNKDYYHSYKELRKDIENARDSAPTIVKEENPKVKNAFNLCGSMLSLFSVFLAIYFIFRIMAFNVAEGKWGVVTSNYNDTQFYKLEEVAESLITTAPANRIDDIYAKIAGFTYKNDDISEYEAAMLVRLLQQIDNNDLLPERVDEIMRNANTKKFKEISTEIVKLDVIGESVGYDLAKAIFNVEVGKSNITAAYEILEKYKDNIDLRNAVIKLKNSLDNDKNISIIAEDTGLSRLEIKALFEEISDKEVKE